MSLEERLRRRECPICGELGEKIGHMMFGTFKCEDFTCEHEGITFRYCSYSKYWYVDELKPHTDLERIRRKLEDKGLSVST